VFGDLVARFVGPSLANTLAMAPLDPGRRQAQREQVPRGPASSKTEVLLLIFFALLAILGIVSTFF
jgi:hypothetical protein